MLQADQLKADLHDLAEAFVHVLVRTADLAAERIPHQAEAVQQLREILVHISQQSCSTAQAHIKVPLL